MPACVQDTGDSGADSVCAMRAGWANGANAMARRMAVPDVRYSISVVYRPRRQRMHRVRAVRYEPERCARIAANVRAVSAIAIGALPGSIASANSVLSKFESDYGGQQVPGSVPLAKSILTEIYVCYTATKVSNAAAHSGRPVRAAVAIVWPLGQGRDVIVPRRRVPVRRPAL